MDAQILLKHERHSKKQSFYHEEMLCGQLSLKNNCMASSSYLFIRVVRTYLREDNDHTEKHFLNGRVAAKYNGRHFSCLYCEE